MAKAPGLSALFVKGCKTPGRHADGGGLYLTVERGGKYRRWVFLYSLNGRRREMGLGSADGPKKVGLAEARTAAGAARTLVWQGVDPIEARREADRESRMPAFGAFCDDFLRDKAGGWRNEKHRAQWAMTLSRSRDDDGNLLDTGYALPLRHKRLDEISVDDVLAVLRPIWGKLPETASRLRGRIENVLDAAKAKGFRSGENPAAWRGHLALILPKPKKLARGHHRAMPFADVPGLIDKLRAAGGVGSLALEFTILTAARSGETRGARWREIDESARLWIVPAERMKGGREHRVPLSDAALDVLRRAAPFRRVSDGDDALIFPGQRHGAPLSDMSISAVLRRLDLDCTVHGFRSSFRDWAGDATNFPRELAEQALAHAIADATEAAYRRGDALEKRRALMGEWSDYLSGGSKANQRQRAKARGTGQTQQPA